MDIEEAVKAYQKGEEKAFEVILRECEGIIFKIISSFNLSLGDYRISRDDLYQEACLGLHDACIAYSDDKGMKFSSFAYLVIKRRVKRAYSGMLGVYRNESASMDNLYRNYDIPLSAEGPEDYRRKRDFYHDMNRFLQSLSNEDKKILRMRMEEKNYKEIAEELQVSVKRVDNKLYRLRRKYEAYRRDKSD